MLKIFVNAVESSGTKNVLNTTSILGSIESVRWRRKPRWLPVAKTKQFRVPERKPQDSDEKLELQRLHNIYKTQMRSLSSYLHEEFIRVAATSTPDHLVVTPDEEAAEFQKIMAINNSWNADIAKKREERRVKQLEEQRTAILERIELKKLRDEELRQQIEETVRLEKERSKTYITTENIDKAIEFALANPVDYNFAIDMNGNIYKGRRTNTLKEDKTSSE